MKEAIFAKEDGNIYWALDNNIKYKVKTDLSLIRARSIQNLKSYQPWKWKNLWKLRLIPKIRVFLRKLANGGIPTNARLSNRGWKGFTQCNYCSNETEDDIHIFFKCNFTNQVWWQVKHIIGIMANPNIIAKLIIKSSYSKKRESYWWKSTMIFTTLWFIWFARYQRIFNRTFINPHSLF